MNAPAHFPPARSDNVVRLTPEDFRSFNEPMRRTKVPLDQERTPICDVFDFDGGDYWRGAV